MKTLTRLSAIVIGCALLAAAVPQKAAADDKTWATVGKVLAGFVGADLLFNHFDSHSAYTRTTVIHAPAHYCSPPPHVIPVRPPAGPPPCFWVPGHYETRVERVWVEGYWKTIETPAVYDWVWNGWCHVRVIIRPATTQMVWVPGHYVTREVQVWVPGHYVCAKR